MRPWLAALLLAWAFAATEAEGQAVLQDCAADPELSYVCGAARPEDVVAIPGTRWLIASGFAPGAGLKLVDTAARTLDRWYQAAPGQLRPDPRSFPTCPGPVDAKLFNARGLSLRPNGGGRWRLLVVNHGGRESVEMFDVETDGTTPRLFWRGCVPMPIGQVGNSVASFDDGAVLVTVLTRPGTSIADFVQQRVTGAVWSWHPGQPAFQPIPGTGLPGNNGIETDPDQRRFYVVAFGWHSVVVFDRRDTRLPIARIEAVDFMPDNIHWSAGHLLVAGMRLDEPACGGLRAVVEGVADPMLCHRGWIVGEVKLGEGRIATVAYGTPQPGFNGLSAAALVGKTFWLGSFQSDRLAVVQSP